MSFDVILPFLRPIEHLIVDPQVTEIMVNGSGPVFIERDGRLELVAGVRLREQSLQVAVRNMARALGDDISEEKPLLDSRLPDGSRVAAVFPPCSLGGTTLTIRKFQSRQFTVEELMRVGTLTTEMVARVHEAMDRRENILISGGTGTGKTTVLNALSAHLPPDDRVIVIEDTAELQLQKPNLVRFEARREQPGAPAVTIRELLRATLRHRGRGSWWGSLRPLAGTEHRPFGHALDDPRQLGSAGVGQVHDVCLAVRCRSAIPSDSPPDCRLVAPAVAP
jgi:pilus assembly protein CpaF